ncbi:inositol-1-monophosphatase [Aliivibrio sp. S3MY1]|uniref:inositol-1-monophosphatase n=1 Tax=unclassified Aliivibrio TaxID=2645654 RepID=UPI000EFA5208|nr:MULTISPECIES: inositol-1-monophosphatase [unclassified Aliivibrio]MDD9196014.1 inositol-1-monophosphatase [Aliivibrio sp. S3MY1]MDD9199319.1 inositol-1-monophosphatase [Aliivibrio sp. S2MY1]
MHPMLNIAIRTARKAGDFVAKSFEQTDKIETTKKGNNEFITNIENDAQYMLVDMIKKSYPDHSIISEESGLIEGKDADVQWIIDPLDGTTNFVKGIPHFSISIAVRIKGRTEVACVYDPIRNELFTAQRGAGAQRNNQRVRVQELKDMNETILATGLPYRQKQHAASYSKVLSAMFVECSDIRSSGCPSLDLCYLAAARIDGFFALGLKPWEMAAADLIARESGVICTDFTGNTDYMKTGSLVAGSPRIVKSMLKKIRENGSEAMAK